MKHARSVVVRIGLDGTWSVLSDAIIETLGYPPDIELPSGLRDSVHPDDVDTAADALRAVRARELPAARIDIRVLAADGRWREMDTVFYDMTDVEGVHAVIAYALDVTDQRAAERRSRTEGKRLRALVRQLDAAVLVEDEDGRTVLANETFARVFGRTSAEDWAGVDRTEILGAVARRCRERATVRAQLDDIATLRKACLGYALELVNGRCLSLDFVPIHDGDTDLGALWYFRDVTEIATTQHELRERNRVLTEAAELKNHFVAAVSHELRTPLTAVASFTEMLRDPASGSLTERQRTAVDAVVRNAERLTRLVDDLQLITQLERHTLPIHESAVDVSELVRLAVEDHRPEADRGGLTLTADIADGPPLTGDPTRLRQVLDNLLSNAVKFTMPQGSVAVRAGCEGSRWTIEVTDTGIGIPDEEVPAVTDTFIRGSNAVRRRLSGSGLGLAICKTITELHHGSLAVESTEDRGTTVRMAVPLKREAR
ncbi:PAS domain-containing sensor histidine kinase [Nocardioides sp. NBC_00368]|uniref:sensor histidine kinase n=1 Tax=Nocardioides sp. NBC_00368 TaxID=2976000 RepID=UPI002E1D1CF5